MEYTHPIYFHGMLFLVHSQFKGITQGSYSFVLIETIFQGLVFISIWFGYLVNVIPLIGYKKEGS
jgi:hypothetical protein